MTFVALPSSTEAIISSYAIRLVRVAYLSESKVTCTQSFLFHVLRNGFHEGLLHNLPGKGREADRSVFPWNFFLAFLESMHEVFLTPVIRNLANHQDLSKMSAVS